MPGIPVRLVLFKSGSLSDSEGISHVMLLFWPSFSGFVSVFLCGSDPCNVSDLKIMISDILGLRVC